jgi:hypothetical protein
MGNAESKSSAPSIPSSATYLTPEVCSGCCSYSNLAHTYAVRMQQLDRMISNVQRVLSDVDTQKKTVPLVDGVGFGSGRVASVQYNDGDIRKYLEGGKLDGNVDGVEQPTERSGIKEPMQASEEIDSSNKDVSCSDIEKSEQQKDVSTPTIHVEGNEEMNDTANTGVSSDINNTTNVSDQPPLANTYDNVSAPIRKDEGKNVLADNVHPERKRLITSKKRKPTPLSPSRKSARVQESLLTHVTDLVRVCARNENESKTASQHVNEQCRNNRYQSEDLQILATKLTRKTEDEAKGASTHGLMTLIKAFEKDRNL